MTCSHALARARWRSVLAVACSAAIALGSARLAEAEEPHESSQSAAAASTAATGAADSEHDEPLARARAVAAVAEPLFAAGHYAAALAEYTRAYQILAGHPRQYWVLHNLATCNERLFRYDLAVELYEEYLRRAPPTETDRAEVSAILETLRSLLATLVVESSVTGEVWLDDRRLGVAPGKWHVPAGHHILEVRADRHESQRREVQLNAGQVKTDRFQLQLLSTYSGPPPGYFWAAVGLAGAATVAGASAGFMALNARQQGVQQAELHLDTSDQAERTRRLALASDIGFGAAILFGATATVLYFVTDWPKSSTPPGPRHEPIARRSLSLALGGPGDFAANVRGTF